MSIILIIIGTYVLFCYFVSTMASNRAISSTALFILSFLFSPLAGFIIALFYPTKPIHTSSAPDISGTASKTCPMCAEQVQRAAKICKHCRHSFEP